MPEPWKPIAERLLKGLPPVPEITTPPSEWHPLNGPPEMQEWSRAMIAAGVSCSTGFSSGPLPRWEDDDDHEHL